MSNSNDDIMLNAHKMDLSKAATLAVNKGFSIRQSSDTYKGRSHGRKREFLYICRGENKYQFSFCDWLPNTRIHNNMFQAYINITPQLIEDCVIAQMIARECWKGD